MRDFSEYKYISSAGELCNISGLSYTFVERNEFDYDTLVSAINKRIRKELTDRDVKNIVYSIKASNTKKDTVWNAYVRKYMSHVVLSIVPIRDKYTNPYIDYRGMEI